MDYKPTLEHRRRISEAIKKWWSTPGTREKMSLAHRISGHSGRRKGSHHTEETKRKISLAQIGKPKPRLSKGTRKRMSEAKKRYWNRLKRYDKSNEVS